MRQASFRSVIRWLLACCVLPVSTSAVLGDVLVLRNGGEIHGQWLNADQQPQESYTILTPQGSKLVLGKDSVKQAIRQTPAEVEYERIASTYRDTVIDQWRLAEWCRERLLQQQRKTHLRRVIELEPDHVAARRALGYSQVEGEWVTKQEIRERKGYHFYRGRWRLAQEIELLEKHEKADQADKEWRSRLQKWRHRLDDESGRQAQQAILAIRDPQAVSPLLDMLRNEPFRGYKTLYIEALGAIGDDRAVGALVVVSLNDPDVEVFHACVDQVVAIKTPLAAELYIRALKNENNVRINRAAAALARLDDKSAISPLIEALVTAHLIQTPGIPGRSSDSTTATFADPKNGFSPSMNGAGFSQGDGSKLIRVIVPNNQVLAALVELTQTTSFGFDQKAWRIWHAAHQQAASPSSISARRD